MGGDYPRVFLGVAVSVIVSIVNRLAVKLRETHRGRKAFAVIVRRCHGVIITQEKTP